MPDDHELDLVVNVSFERAKGDRRLSSDSGPLHELRKVVCLPAGKLRALSGSEHQQLADGGWIDAFPIARHCFQGAPTNPQRAIQRVHERNHHATLFAGAGGQRDSCLAWPGRAG